ncbi:hypothetical protein PCE1_002368 [Barthelona sp. PCE]
MDHLHCKINDQTLVVEKLERFVDDKKCVVKLVGARLPEAIRTIRLSKVPRVILFIRYLSDFNLTKCRELLTAHPEIANQTTAYREWRPVHYCADFGTKQQLKLLMDFNIDLNVIDKNHQHPLHIAASSNNLGMVVSLLKNNDQIQYVGDIHGETPLFLAIQRHASIMNKRNNEVNANLALLTVRTLLQCGSNPMLYTASDQMTCYHLASQYGDYEVLQLLLSAGKSYLSDINHVDKEGDNCLHFVCYEAKCARCVQLLIEHGADPSQRNNLERLPGQELGSNEKDLAIKALLNNTQMFSGSQRKSKRALHAQTRSPFLSPGNPYSPYSPLSPLNSPKSPYSPL